jgi:hypothetical protein
MRDGTNGSESGEKLEGVIVVCLTYHSDIRLKR